MRTPNIKIEIYLVEHGYQMDIETGSLNVKLCRDYSGSYDIGVLINNIIDHLADAMQTMERVRLNRTERKPRKKS